MKSSKKQAIKFYWSAPFDKENGGHIVKECTYAMDKAQLVLKEYQDPANVRIALIPGKTVSQGRPRTRVVQPKGGKPFAHVYNPNSTDVTKFERTKEQYHVPPNNDESHYCAVISYASPPKSWSHKKKLESYDQFKNTHPDAKNILSFYEDIFQGFLFPSDQYLNPTIALRYYHQKDFTLVISAPSASVRLSTYQYIHKHFATKLAL